MNQNYFVQRCKVTSFSEKPIESDDYYIRLSGSLSKCENKGFFINPDFHGGINKMFVTIC